MCYCFWYIKDWGTCHFAQFNSRIEEELILKAQVFFVGFYFLVELLFTEKYQFKCDFSYWYYRRESLRAKGDMSASADSETGPRHTGKPTGRQETEGGDRGDGCGVTTGGGAAKP